MRRAVPVVLALVLAGCGTSPFEACVLHSVEEGVERSAAEQACRDAGVGQG